MADQNKFEQMLEKLVNEDKAGAEELFHEIVVEKSRDIYESLLESDLEDEEVDEATDEEVDESDEDLDEANDEEVDESDDEELDEDFNLDEFEVEADPMDAMMGDMEVDGGEAPAMDMDMGDEEESDEARIDDLEDALEDLKAEFDKMMSGDDSDDDDDDGEDAGDMDMDMDMDSSDDDAEEEAIAFETTDEEVDEAETADKSATETMREYVEKVSATMGDNGANSKSTVAGANDMGGTASNLNQAGTEAGAEAGAGSTIKGNALSDTSAKDMNTKNVNVPGGKAAKAGKTEPGHGAEKKSKPETADNKKSVVGK